MGFGNQMEKDYQAILQTLKRFKVEIPPIPSELKAIVVEGEAFAIAYPIQGLLKYHGLADYGHRIANFSSVSLNNTSAYTLSYVKFDQSLSDDNFILNGSSLPKQSAEYGRIRHQLNNIRRYAQVETKAMIISRNLFTDTNEIAVGKGLGTSASGGAAIAHAAIAILYRGNDYYADNPALRSLYARYLAGSASRSAVGGIGLWLSHPSINPLDSISVRLDLPRDKKLIESIDLITVPVESPVKTDQAHRISQESPFYRTWAENRKEQIRKFLASLYANNFQEIANAGEYDTLCLHSITMTGTEDKNLIVWAPETLKIMHLVREMRAQGIQAYFSIDTGPSVVILTLKHHTDTVVNGLKKNLPEKLQNHISIGSIGGPSRIIDANSTKASLLRDDLAEYVK